MRPFFTGKRLILFVLTLLLAGGGIWALVYRAEPAPPEAPEARPLTPKTETIGRSVQGRPIEAYTYGSGENRLVFVGGIHGGYEWNSVLLAYRFMDYLETQTALPDGLEVTVIPSANPDGVYAVVGKEGRFAQADIPAGSHAAGRFNANEVDLNRNFDCKWKPESSWQGRTVSAGAAPFSEPEAKALRDFLLKDRPRAAVFWHSAANAVYASECEAGILQGTLDAMNAYARAAGYSAVQTFDAYPITGDAEGWLASQNIPAITVELQTHESVEWERNLAGIKGLFELYSPARTQ